MTPPPTVKRRALSRKDWAGETLREEFSVAEDQWPKGDEFFEARVVEVHKGFAFVSPERQLYQIDLNDVWLGTVPRRFLLAKKSTRKLLAVGDRVCCQRLQENEPLPRCWLIKVAPRQACLTRDDPANSELEHVIAVNVDKLVIVGSFVTPPLSFHLIDRYLVLAALQDIRPIIFLNKVDLLQKSSVSEQQQVDKRINYYRQLGYQVLLGQANNQSQQVATDDLQKNLMTGLSVFAGHSGVGKSSLVNRFSPLIPQAVEQQRLTTGGRHVTTFASLISLGAGGYVIDTPGIKRFLLGKIKASELRRYFCEFIDKDCRYRSCLHEHEPQCAIKDAVAEGSIDQARYDSYLSMLRECQ